MLHYLRTKRLTLGRGVLAIVASTWLLLAFQSCVVAATADMSECGAVAASMGDHAGQQQGAQDTAADPGCCPPVVCQALATADHKAVDHGATVHSDLYVLQPNPPFGNIAAELTAATARLGRYQPDYLPPHPTVRFCVLRI